MSPIPFFLGLLLLRFVFYECSGQVLSEKSNLLDIQDNEISQLVVEIPNDTKVLELTVFGSKELPSLRACISVDHGSGVALRAQRCTDANLQINDWIERKALPIVLAEDGLRNPCNVTQTTRVFVTFFLNMREQNRPSRVYNPKKSEIRVQTRLFSHEQYFSKHTKRVLRSVQRVFHRDLLERQVELSPPHWRVLGSTDYCELLKGGQEDETHRLLLPHVNRKKNIVSFKHDTFRFIHFGKQYTFAFHVPDELAGTAPYKN
ncbi:MAG: hypothetical protein MHM6MM_003510 [Cercozoa sp. M6MM]